MEIHELRSLASVSRTGNISRSAELLHLTPSAIHRHLKLLGEKLQLTLYERGSNGLHLTPAATSLIPLVEDLLLQHEAILGAANDIRAHRRGSVRIGAGPTFSSYVLPPLLKEFRQKYPKIDISLEAGQAGQILSELSEGTIDLVFLVPWPGIENDYTVEHSWGFELPLIANPSHVFPASPRLKDFATTPFLLYRKGSNFENQLDIYFASHGFSPRVAMRLDNAEPIKALVKSGFGVSLLADWAVQREVDAGELVKIPLKEPLLQSRIALIRRRGKYIQPAAEALIETARSWQSFGRTPSASRARQKKR